MLTLLPSYFSLLKLISRFLRHCVFLPWFDSERKLAEQRLACNGKFILPNGSVIFVVTGYIQLAVNIVIPRHLHRLLCPNKRKAKLNNTNCQLKSLSSTFNFDHNAFVVCSIHPLPQPQVKIHEGDGTIVPYLVPRSAADGFKIGTQYLGKKVSSRGQ